MERAPGGDILLYQTEDGQTRVEVHLDGETVWLTQKQMAELFQKDIRTINEHIGNIFEEGELKPDLVIRKFRITASDNKTYEALHYNLDVIISVGYRVKSHRGVQFRIWATQRLKDISSKVLQWMMNGLNVAEAEIILMNCWLGFGISDHRKKCSIARF